MKDDSINNSKIKFQKIKEPIYEEFFTEKQSDNYDLILDFSSFEQLKKNGWNAYFTPKGYEKYKNCLDKKTNVIGVVGSKNRGKSFFLGRIMEEDKNYIPPSGFLVTTHGISCCFPKIANDEDENYFPIITLDAAGKDNPLLQNAYIKNNIEEIARDQKVTEIVLSDFFIQKANILIAVIEQLTFAEQEMLKTLIERLKQREIEEHEKRKLIVIHNLMNISTSEDIENFKKNILLKSLTFELEETCMLKNVQKEYDDSDKIYYIQTNHNKNTQKDKLLIYHFILGNDLNDNIKKEYNDPALRFIRDLITIETQKPFDIIKEFQDFIIKNSLKYLYGEKFNGFSKEELIIGEKASRKIYIDKEKKQTKDIIQIPIILKDKNIEFEPRKFKYDGENYTFLSNIEPRYSAKIIKQKESHYLEITFEMFGKVTIENNIVDYDDDNNQIIITIKGKTEEINKSDKTIIESIQNELKYMNFDFQVKILKFISNKENDGKIFYEIDIQDENPVINKDENKGIYQLLFPIKLYEKEKN